MERKNVKIIDLVVNVSVIVDINPNDIDDNIATDEEILYAQQIARAYVNANDFNYDDCYITGIRIDSNFMKNRCEFE